MQNDWRSRSPPRITIVEDDIMMSIHLEDLLLENAYQVARTAMNTAEALRTIPKDNPDAVLLDLELAEKGAIEIARELGARNTPLVCITAYPSLALTHPVLQGAPFLQKPWRDKQVLQELQRVLACGHALQHTSAPAHLVSTRARSPLNENVFQKVRPPRPEERLSA